MDRSKIVETCREVIYECVPDMDDVKIPQRQWSKMSTFGDVVNAFDKRINRRF